MEPILKGAGNICCIFLNQVQTYIFGSYNKHRKFVNYRRYSMFIAEQPCGSAEALVQHAAHGSSKSFRTFVWICTLLFYFAQEPSDLLGFLTRERFLCLQAVV